MDFRPDTSSSGRFRGQWSFLASPPQHAQRPHSLAPSSYIPQSDRSSSAPLPTNLHHPPANGSRSSLPRNLTTASIGGRSSASIPSQPVLIRVHSADASAHTNPAPRPRRPIKMQKATTLPALSEYSLQGILAAIQEDIESDVNTISEILGRSRLVLADQHDSQMPPQGEIRAVPSALQAVDELDAIDEQMDDVLIMREDASLMDGSYAPSAAYGLLERLQAVPRNTRVHSEWPVADTFGHVPQTSRTNSSPTVLHSISHEDDRRSYRESHRGARNLLQSPADSLTAPRTTNAVVSESRLSAAANGGPTQLSPDSAYGHTTHDVLGHDLELEPTGAQDTFRDRIQNLLYVSDPTGLSTWLQGQSHAGSSGSGQSAEGHLRHLLEK